MRPLSLTSGNMIVDRRTAFAAALARVLDFAGAAEVMADAVELAPHWAAGWKLLGDYRSHAGDDEGAAAAYGKVAELDTQAVFGAGLTLAAHGVAPMPVGTDVGYVEALFDEYASRFDRELLVDLGYRLPAALGGLVTRALEGRRVARAVDLGCGTGLMGVEIRAHCDRLEGVDLSGRMLSEAKRKRIYDSLDRGELVEFLATDAGGIDLITAADVINYCGVLPPVLAVAYQAMSPGGLFGFSLELHEGKGTLLQRRQLRYAHNADEALAQCGEAGFEVEIAERVALRRERDVPVIGLVLMLRKPAAQPASATSSAA